MELFVTKSSAADFLILQIIEYRAKRSLHISDVKKVLILRVKGLIFPIWHIICTDGSEAIN